jgi:hypothetical protein
LYNRKASNEQWAERTISIVKRGFCLEFLGVLSCTMPFEVMDHRGSTTASSHYFEDIHLPAEVSSKIYAVTFFLSNIDCFISMCALRLSLCAGKKQYCDLIFVCYLSNLLATFIGQRQIGFWNPNTMPDHQGWCHLIIYPLNYLNLLISVA